MKLLKITVAYLLLGAGMNVSAMTGNQLLELCSHFSPGNINESGSYCHGYVVGVNETLPPDLTQYICIPDSVDSHELTLVVQRYLTDNTSLLQDEASWLVTWALINAYPCREIPPE
jgi:hypothetical protein